PVRVEELPFPPVIQLEHTDDRAARPHRDQGNGAITVVGAPVVGIYPRVSFGCKFDRSRGPAGPETPADSETRHGRISLPRQDQPAGTFEYRAAVGIAGDRPVSVAGTQEILFALEFTRESVLVEVRELISHPEPEPYRIEAGGVPDDAEDLPGHGMQFPAGVECPEDLPHQVCLRLPSVPCRHVQHLREDGDEVPVPVAKGRVVPFAFDHRPVLPVIAVSMHIARTPSFEHVRRDRGYPGNIIFINPGELPDGLP